MLSAKNLHLGHVTETNCTGSSERHILKKQYVEAMTQARFSAQVTQTEVELRDSLLFLPPQMFWVRLGTTSPQQTAWDGAACGEEIFGCLSGVHISQSKTKPGSRLPCCATARVCGPSKSAGVTWLPSREAAPITSCRAVLSRAPWRWPRREAEADHVKNVRHSLPHRAAQSHPRPRGSHTPALRHSPRHGTRCTVAK